MTPRVLANLANPGVRRVVLRELRARRLWSLIMASLTAVPVLLTFVVAATVATSWPAAYVGQRPDAGIRVVSESTDDGLAAPLPGALVSYSYHRSIDVFGRTTVQTTDHDLTDPNVLNGGEFPPGVMLAGHAPTVPGEAAVTEALMRTLLSDAGRPSSATSVETALGREFAWGEDTLTIVAVLADDWTEDRIVVAPGQLDDATWATFGLFDDSRLVDAVSQDPGSGSMSVAGSTQPAPTTESALLVFVGLSMVTLTTAAAAWGASARRRTHTTGLLVASGASAEQTSAVQVGQAIVLATGGVGAAWLSCPLVVPLAYRWLESTPGGQAWPWGIRWPLYQMVSVSLLAAFAATIAGWWPTRAADRVSIDALLAGRSVRPTHRPINAAFGLGIAVLGFLMMSSNGGAVNSTLATAGIFLLTVAALILLRWGFGAASAAGAVMRPLPRLVLRDAARHAGRWTACTFGIGAAVAFAWLTVAALQDELDQSRNGEALAAAGPTPEELPASVLVADPTAHRREATADEVSRLLSAGLRSIDTVGFERIELQAYRSAANANWLTHRPSSPLGPDLPVDATIDLLAPDEALPADAVRADRHDVILFSLPAGHGVTLDDLAADQRLSVGQHDRFEPFADPARTLRQQMIFLAIGSIVAVAVSVGLTLLGASEVSEHLATLDAVGARPSFRRRYLALQSFLQASVAVVSGLSLATIARGAVLNETTPIQPLALLVLLSLPVLLAAFAASLPHPKPAIGSV